MAREEKTTDGQILYVHFTVRHSVVSGPQTETYLHVFLEDVSRTYILVVLHNDYVVY
jgi:hypothetical protein